MVIPALNSAETIGYTLSSIFSNKFKPDGFEVIVVDNGSSDNTENIVKRFPARLYFCEKRGMCAALNLGIKNAKGDIICITVSDCIVPDDWLEKISEFFGAHPDVEGVGGPVLSPLNGFKNNIQRFTAELWVEDQKFPTKVIETQNMAMYAGGLIAAANCAYRRETVISQGFFDESVEWGEVDFCWKLVKKGKRLMFNPEIETVHLGSPWTIRGVFRQQFKWGKAFAEILKKHSSFNIVDDLKRETWFSRQLVKAFLLLLSPSRESKTKQLVRLCHYLSFHLGLIYGRS